MIYYLFYGLAIYLFIGITAFLKMNADGEYERFVLEARKNEASMSDIPVSFTIKAGCIITILMWPRWILDLI